MSKLFTLGVLALFIFIICSCKKNKAIQIDNIGTDFQWVTSERSWTGTINSPSHEIAYVKDSSRFYWTLK